jgi:hypothetical protein
MTKTKMTAQEMQDKFDTAMSLLFELAYEENFNEHLRTYDIEASFDEFVTRLSSSVAFTEKDAKRISGWIDGYCIAITEKGKSA